MTADLSRARALARREREIYDQSELPDLLEQMADELEAYRAREVAERELLQHRLQRAAEMRRGEAI